MTIDFTQGQPVQCTPIRDSLCSAAVPVGQIFNWVPDPRNAENPRATYTNPMDKAASEMRNDVQRMIKGTQKGKNADVYAEYISAGMRGDHGHGWSTPPIALWFPQRLAIHKDETSPFGPVHLAIVPHGAKAVVVDAETQLLAHFIVAENPEAYGLTLDDLTQRTVMVELYHGIDLKEARQIFHDRNMLGVLPTKNVALNSDSRDIATQIAFAVMDEVIVENPRTKSPSKLLHLVGVNKRQLSGRDPEWITLSGLRSFVATTLFGRGGFEVSSQPVYERDLPVRADGRQTTEEEVKTEIVKIARLLFNRFESQFTQRQHTVIGAPAVLAGLGAVAHKSMSWCKEPDRRQPEELIELLSSVNWNRTPENWVGIAGKSTSSGRLSLAGGVKDNGSKTAAALDNPHSEGGMQVRRQAVAN